jgi:hypothetical protein
MVRQGATRLYEIPARAELRWRSGREHSPRGRVAGMVARAVGTRRKSRLDGPGLAPQNSADSRADLTYQRFMSRDWLLGYVQAAAREQSDKNLPNR